MATSHAQQRSEAAFQQLIVENEKALTERLDAYEHALMGGVAVAAANAPLAREQWRAYVQTLDLKRRYPATRGIGYVLPVDAQDLHRFEQQMRQDGMPEFAVHRATPDGPLYVTKYVEPEATNKGVLGLNIAFETRRREAAERSRDTGESTITSTVSLLDTSQTLPGFLWFVPVYEPSLPHETQAERRAALRGWVYAGFTGKSLLRRLTPAQGTLLNMTVHGAPSATQEALLYADDTSLTATSTFAARKTLTVLQQQWIVEWRGTSVFEAAQRSDWPLIVLVSGLAATLALGTFVTLLMVRKPSREPDIAPAASVVIPLIVFCVSVASAVALYRVLDAREVRFLQRIVTERAAQIRLLIDAETQSKLLALRRMARRWNAANGTPEEQWRRDAATHVSQLEGLRAVEWIDSTHHIRWIEPTSGNEKAVGLNVIADPERAVAFEAAALQDAGMFTPPFDLVQGYRGFIAYSPIQRDGNFDGFLAAVFSLNDFFTSMLTPELLNDFEIRVRADGTDLFVHDLPDGSTEDAYIDTSTFPLAAKQWEMQIAPSTQFTSRYRTWLPHAILIAGIAIATLLSLTVRAVLIAKSRAHHLTNLNGKMLRDEAARREAVEALRTSEATFRGALQAASIGMALVKPNGHWLMVNPAVCELLGYEEKELLSNDFQSITHPDDLERDMQFVVQMLAGEIDSYRMEKRYFHRSGRVVWGLLSVSLARDSRGEPLYFVSQIQDITEQKEIERLKNEFISVVSHELRTPLTSIRGSLGLILGSMANAVPQNVKTLLDIAHNNCERLIPLINDILDIDKMAAGKMRFDVQEHSLARIVGIAIEEMRAYAEKLNVSLSPGPIDADVKLAVDETRLIQVLSNLLSNAAKFSPAGSEVFIGVQVSEACARIFVQDNGPGIPETFRARIFEKFSQADSSSTRRAGGTGLGLHITRQIVERMHGRIGFDTQVGQGTTFWVEFPLVSNNARSLSESAVLPLPPEPAILHVEDDVDLSNVIAAALAEHAEVVLARDLRQAEELLSQRRFSLLLLDMNLPDGSAVKLLDRLQNQQAPSIPTVILSAEAPSQDIERRVDAVMVKTRVSEARVVQTILEVLKRPRKAA